MAFTIVSRETFAANALNIDASRTFSGELNVALNQSIANGAVDQEIILGIDTSQLQCIVLHSDRDLTIKTNDSAAPTDTLTMQAGIPRVWRTGDYAALFLTADVTKIFVSNASGADANLKILTLEDLP